MEETSSEGRPLLNLTISVFIVSNRLVLMCLKILKFLQPKPMQYSMNVEHNRASLARI